MRDIAGFLKSLLTDFKLRAFLNTLDRERQVVFENWNSNCRFSLVHRLREVRSGVVERFTCWPRARKAVIKFVPLSLLFR